MLPRRTLLAAPALLLAARAAAAQEAWPTRPVRMVLPYAAGGATDVICRLVADRLSARLPQRVIVENRTGAGGSIGASNVAKSPGDGHHLLFHNIGHAVTRVLYPQLDYDPATDLKPATIVAESPMVLLVPPNSPHRSVQDMVAFAKANPERLTYGSTGGGGALQLVSLLFLRAAGIRMTEVPYRGGAPAALDLANGSLDMLYDAGLTGFGLAQGGRARALAISGPQRSPVMPDVPTMAELGFPDATFMVWQAVFAPGTTPAPVLARIQEAVAAVLAEPATRTRLAELGAERLVGNTPEEAQRYVAAEMDKWAVILREAGVRAG
ncbi:Bug family tripartite tricarboxylate transporter substrate binding protein [Falsiroseomonas sp.]|uniref:Bug family tripartite tricarboxylate transporter substrate binding protein n=1 Tax=Falsiroseomonas sp. TaxID=2870721 RepID=UPI00356A034A